MLRTNKVRVIKHLILTACLCLTAACANSTESTSGIQATSGVQTTPTPAQPATEATPSPAAAAASNTATPSSPISAPAPDVQPQPTSTASPVQGIKASSTPSPASRPAPTVTPSPSSRPPTVTPSPSVTPKQGTTPTPVATALSTSVQILADAFKNKTSNFQVQSSGLVSRILADDNDGDRHQRFILKLSSGQTLLIAHNIDLSTRIGGLKTGDSVEFYGEYEWNDQGGVIHWTHKDPDHVHADGWLKHQGTKYE